MKRKLLSLILVAAMLASMLVFAPTSGAAVDAGKAEVAVTDATVAAGDQVSVDVIVTTDKLQTFDLGFKYDATKLELVEWAKKGGAKLPAEVLGDFATTSGLSLNSNLGLVGFGASNANGVALDANDGLTIATITFNVKAGATPGDTYVEFSNANGLYVRPNTSDIIDGDNLITKAGKITILPAGYEEATQWVVLEGLDVPQMIEEEDPDTGDIVEVPKYCYTVLDEDEMTCQLDARAYQYATIKTGCVEIPATINGYTVTTLSTDAFRDAGYTKVKVPATVTTIKGNVFTNMTACTEIYVLNQACTAFASSFDTAAKSTVVYAYENAASNSVQGRVTTRMATKTYLSFAAYAPETTLTYTVGSETYSYVVGNSTTAPGSAVVNGEVIVAWNDGVNNIAPGASMTIAGDTTLAPVTIKAPVTDNGASVKPAASAADLAIRFTSKLAIADYEKLGEIGKVQLGMLITPQKYVDYATAFTKADLAAWVVSQGYQAKDAYVDVQVNSYLSMDANDYTIAASLKGFSTATTTNNPTFAAIAYAEITIGENVVTVYGSYDKACGRDAKSVLEAAHAEADGEIKTWISDLIDEFTK